MTGTSIATLGFQGKTSNRGETIATLGFIAYLKNAPAIPFYMWDDLESIPYEYEVHRGVSEDEFPDEFEMFSFQSSMILILAEPLVEDGGHIIVQLSYDGENVNHMRLFTSNDLWMVQVRGFRVANDIAEPHIPYQIIPMR